MYRTGQHTKHKHTHRETDTIDRKRKERTGEGCKARPSWWAASAFSFAPLNVLRQRRNHSTTQSVFLGSPWPPIENNNSSDLRGRTPRHADEELNRASTSEAAGIRTHACILLLRMTNSLFNYGNMDTCRRTINSSSSAWRRVRPRRSLLLLF